MQPVRLLVLLLVLVTETHAVMFNLVAPTDPVPVGAELHLNLLILNPEAAETALAVPVALAGHLSDRTRVWNVDLLARTTSEPVVIAAGGFAVREFLVKLPAEARGRLVLEIETPAKAKVVIETMDETTKTATPKPPLSNFAPPRTIEAAIKRTFAGRLSPHESIYFIYGDEQQAAKFQFSFKYRLLGDRGQVGEVLPALRSLYFGFTQRSLWDIQANSSPFYDTSYMPELIYESQSVIEPEAGGGAKWLGYQIGIKHESNGREGLASRSLNTVYFRPGVAFGRFDGWSLIVAPRIWTYVSDLDNNPDIRDYRGNAELLLVLGKNESLSLALTGRLGRGGRKGSLQADFSVPVRFDRMFDFATYFLIQYWEGYSESLIDYNQRTSSLRAGFSFVR
ncbi:MAG: phospholipase A [Cephaloticoccus sp.]|nr:phospholipase A [Cephaloticoccus sp.]